ncbi:hypothetical protein XAB3213_420019 [Xanthomonas citri pv. bilvae]|nr:hypothetical protein XAB3213_420019 [Xanthomonas citri pv. bilvae]
MALDLRVRGTSAGWCFQRLFADDLLLQILLPGESAWLRPYPHPNPFPAGGGALVSFRDQRGSSVLSGEKALSIRAI